MDNDRNGPQEPTIDFIPTIVFVKRGVAKEQLEKVHLTAAELAKVISDTRNELEDEDSDDNESSDNVMDTVDNDNNGNENDENLNQQDEYNFDRYDDEDSGQVASIANVAIIDQNDTIADEENDSEAEDEIIRPTDNLLLVGHVSDDCATMEVWIFNQEEESLYTHHDFLLPSFPLCYEWLSYDPGSDEPGNFVAIGHMDPIITLWDLDIQDSFTPTYRLGQKAKRSKNKPSYGHKDAVLDLSWHKSYTHILASASVDKTVLLWDLEVGEPNTIIDVFKDKVQSIEFHPNDSSELLLTGCADGYIRLFDCRAINSDNTIKWKIKSLLSNYSSNGKSIEIEKCVWNPNNQNYFASGMNNGLLTYIDIRKPNEVIWSKNAHDDEISDICFNTQVNNLMTTSSVDGYFKIWKFNENEIKEVYRHDFELGRLQCMKQCPEDPFTFAFGGEKNPKLRVYNIKNFESVRTTFNIE